MKWHWIIQRLWNSWRENCGKTATMFNAHFLFASLIWGSIGLGYFVYGKKQSSLAPMAGGILLIVVSYFVGSALLMSLLSICIIVAIHVLLRRGY